MRVSDFDYHLPESAIAQTPLADRDRSRLMVADPATGKISHHRFFELPELLPKNAVLVLNESRVIPARLELTLGGGKTEILIAKPMGADTWLCMVKPDKKFMAGREWQVGELTLSVKEVTQDGLRVIQFEAPDFGAWLKKHGQTPTPPYIKEKLADPERYQTIYAKTEGSAAAPTAGLHFTPAVFEGLSKKGIQTEFITLHVGLGTFQSVKSESVETHKMHSEWFSLSGEVAARLNQAKKEGRPIIAVGTTSVRVLESCVDENGLLQAKTGETDIFIYPGYRWKFVEGMVTNFHVPKSTLLMLVSAFAGREFILRAYKEALEEGYRFFSLGDAMLLLARRAQD